MPNFIYCSLNIEGEKQRIQEVKESISLIDEHDNHRAIDFNKIIPMPEDLNVSDESDAQLFYKRDYLKKQLDEAELHRIKKLTSISKLSAKSLAKQYHNNKIQYGYTTWYDWCTANWGSKWNAVISDDDRLRNRTSDTIFFQTAWNPPIPIMNHLAYKYPKVKFVLEYFEEQDPKDVTTVEFHIGEPPKDS